MLRGSEALKVALQVLRRYRARADSEMTKAVSLGERLMWEEQRNACDFAIAGLGEELVMVEQSELSENYYTAGCRIEIEPSLS